MFSLNKAALLSALAIALTSGGVAMALFKFDKCFVSAIITKNHRGFIKWQE